VRELLEQALEAERRELFPDPSDAARMRELELDTLPDDTARAVQALKPYEWRSDEARQAYEAIDDLLRREVLDSQFKGMKQALEHASPQDLQAVKDMLADLNAMLEADARGEHTPSSSPPSWTARGVLPVPARDARGARRRPRPPGRRAAAADGLADPAAAPGARRARAGRDGPRPRRADGAARRRAAQRPSGPAVGRSARGCAASRAWGWATRRRRSEELADLDDLESALGQDYPGPSLDDVDEAAVQRALGAAAVDDVAALRRIERELLEQGYLVRDGRGRLELSPRRSGRVGATGAAQGLPQLEAGGRGGHDVQDAAPPGETTGRQPALAVRRRAAARRRADRAQRRCCGPAPTGGSGCTSTTSRSSRPSAAPPRPSRCSSTCRSRWSCAGPGARPSRPRWPCTRW
jgi:hypothetical protein